MYGTEIMAFILLVAGIVAGWFDKGPRSWLFWFSAVSCIIFVVAIPIGLLVGWIGAMANSILLTAMGITKLFAIRNKRANKVIHHSSDELAADNILVRDIVHSLPQAELLEDYPDYFKGPCVLLLQFDGKEKPVHTVWGIPKGETSPAVLITAYRPDPIKWSKDLRRRVK